MPDREHEGGTAEDVQFTEVDRLRLVEVAGSAEHHEQRLAVALELRTLVRDDRILDRELVQIELLCRSVQLSLGRAVEPDPGHRRRIGEARERLGQSRRRRDASTVAVHRTVDDAGLDQTGLRRGGHGLPGMTGRHRVLRRDHVVGGARGTTRKDGTDRTLFTHANTAFGKVRGDTVGHGSSGHQSNATRSDGVDCLNFSWYSRLATHR